MNIPRTFHIQTFGCQMNASDSEWLVRSLTARGFVESPFEDAAFYILNTCSVREKAEQKVYSELGRIARYCKVHGRTNVTMCVGGCVAQHAGEQIMKRFPQVRLVFGTDGIARAPEAVCRLAEEPRLRLKLLDFTEEYDERDDVRLWRGSEWRGAAPPHLPGRGMMPLHPHSRKTAKPFSGIAGSRGLSPLAGESEGAEPPQSPQGAWGPTPGIPIPPTVFVNIMQGCDNYCSYCIVPYVRGPQKSRDIGAVLAECRTLARGGAREITLLGQNVNSYGQDQGNRVGKKSSFAELLYAVAAIPGLERLRFVTSHPKDIAPEVIRAFAELDALCPRLHLPLQSGSDRILAAMNRRYDTARYMAIVEQLKKARPDILLTTDIIVGFPGETEEDFQATMRIMGEVGFASSFSFVYSDRPHARAVLLPDKIDRAVALERLSRLQEWQNNANDTVLASMKGEECVILLEGKSRLDALLPENGQTDPPDAARAFSPDRQAPDLADAARDSADESVPLESWQGKTPQGFIVNVELPARPGPEGSGWLGAMLPVRIDAAARHSLKGSQAGAPW